MAKVKVKLGENEIEIDSRDFYIDNETIGQVIQNISQYIPENSAKVIYDEPASQPEQESQPIYESLDSLDNAEVFEPEFDPPKYVQAHELKSKLKILQTASFFDSPRTVTETVQKLSEYGWTASPLDVSKALAKMAMSREMTKSSQSHRNYYSAKKTITA